MRVLLINPSVRRDIGKRYIEPVVRNLFYNSPPLGLGYLAGVLEEKGIPVRVIDAAVENLRYAVIIGEIKRFQADLIGISSTTNFFNNAVELAQRIKEEFPNLIVVIGGHHVTADPRHALSFKCFDIGVMGEGELTFLELIRFLERKEDLNKVTGVVFCRDSRVVFTDPREPIENLDMLPFPARHLLPIKLYRPQPNDQYLLPKLSMITSRGCPYNCIFCDKSVFGKIYRSFSPRYIVSEMKHLIGDFNAKDIAFLDSTFTVSRERVKAIINEMRRHNLKVKWTCTVRANVMTKDLLKEMKEAGCWRIRLGAESGNEEVLRFIKKGIAKQQIRDVANWAHQLGLQPKGFFMIGHLVDTRETIEETINFAKSLPFKDITVQINTPMLNTAQYEIIKEHGTLATEDYSEFSYWQPVFVSKNLTKEFLMKAHRRFYRSFYLRPIIFWRHICNIKSWHNVIKYFCSLNLIGYLFFSRLKHIKE